MGLLVNGVWHDRWYDTESSGGRFQRDAAAFRNWITTDGSAGPSGDAGFQAEPGRYHLYVSLACPWAHRTLIFRRLKGLEDVISLSVVNPYMGEYGWTFEAGEGVIPDPIHQCQRLYELYQIACSDFSGRVTVPVLWDRETDSMVSNESSEIIRMMNSAFDHITGNAEDYYPKNYQNEIDSLNERVYMTVNNGVYKAGFATQQVVYEEAVDELFQSLQWLDQLLGSRRFLAGERLTEADWRLFTTLIRFEAVYYGHFKCNKRSLTDFTNLWGFALELFQYPNIAETVNFSHIKTHYYASHPSINPNGIIPVGPDIDYWQPHRREQLIYPRH